MYIQTMRFKAATWAFSSILIASCTATGRERVIDKAGLDERVTLALETLSIELLRNHLLHISSDQMEGRKMGSKGGKAVTEYISKQFRDAGLEPVGDKEEGIHTYFQSFKYRGVQGRNCVGLLKGSGNKFKDEIVVISAHHDHLGMIKTEERDGIFNGADDNASGVTALISIAKAIQKSGILPRRSILFVTFDGEEIKLCGSDHYTKYPITRWSNHVAMINMDMIGRVCTSNVDPWDVNLEVVGTVYWKEGEKLMDMIRSNAKRNYLKTFFELKPGARLRSDHKLFIECKVPVIYFHQEPGNDHHSDYHMPSDEEHKILYDRMLAVTRTIFLTLLDVTNLDERPSFKKN